MRGGSLMLRRLKGRAFPSVYVRGSDMPFKASCDRTRAGRSGLGPALRDKMKGKLGWLSILWYARGYGQPEKQTFRTVTWREPGPRRRSF